MMFIRLGSARSSVSGPTCRKRLGAGAVVAAGAAIIAASLPAAGTATRASGTATRAVSPIRFSSQIAQKFASVGGLGASGRLAQVSGTISCTGGLGKRHLVRLRVKVSQPGVVAEGFTLGRCTGNLELWSAVVVVRASKRLHRGHAQGHAWVGIPRFGSGMTKAVFDWTSPLKLL